MSTFCALARPTRGRSRSRRRRDAGRPPRSEYPLTVDVADEMGAYGSDHHYDFVLDQFLRGLQ
jgi:hypothetical protein